MMQEILAQYFGEGPCRVRDLGSEAGTNNTTKYVSAAAGEFVVRVYQNFDHPQQIRYEHRVLEELGKRELPFQIPRPVRTLSGDTLAQAANGQYAALFERIPGGIPDRSNARHNEQMGRAAAELSRALREVDMGGYESVFAPHDEYFTTHPLVTPESLAAFVNGEALAAAGAEAAVRSFRALKEEVDAAKDGLKRLPHQVIHCDLNVSNMLHDGDRVTGVLDFEFASPDMRAMDLVTCLLGYVGHAEETEERIAAFLKGWNAVEPLREDEVAALPLLCKLRLLVSFLHRLGRYLAGRSSLQEVTENLERLRMQKEWVEERLESLALAAMK